MKAGVVHAREDIRYEEIEKPVPKKGQVLIKVKYTGICGSDVPRVNGDACHFFPNVLGHEFSGTVEEVGEDVTSVKPGDRVAGVPLVPCMECEDCQKGNYSLCKHYSFIGSREFGSFAEYVVVPEKNAVKFEDSVSFEQGAFFEPATVALHGLERVDFKGGKTVAILGGGTIGMFVMQWAKIFGAKEVVVFDISDERLELGKRLGATAGINTLEEDFMDKAMALTGGKGYDYDVEVLTTCVKNYVTGDNEYPEGEEILNGVLVRRFYSDPVEPDLHKSYVRQAAPAKKWRHFLYRCRLLKPLSYVKPIWHYKEQEEIKALNSQFFYSSSMYAFIRENKASYRAFIPLSFFPHTYYTALYAPEKTILIPTMHNNGSSFRSIITSVFSEVAYIGFNIEAEQKLVENIVGKPLAAHGIISVGIEKTKAADWERTKVKYNLPEDYLLYVGRIDAIKLNNIVDYFLSYKKKYTGSRLKLVLVGGIFGKTVEHPDIIYTGFVDDAEKVAIQLNAKVIVNPSRYESLSLILLETMSEGKAMLVNGRCNVLREHCEKSNYAALYYMNRRDFIRKLHNLENSETLRQQMGEKGRHYVQENYNWEMIIGRMKNVIQMLS